MKKITRAQLFKYLSFSFFGACLIVPIPLLIYTSISNTRNFVLGNYQSYMSPDVMDTLSKQQGLSFDYFETSEDVKKLLKKNTIDISNTTSYDLVDLIQEDLVAKLDWSKFALEKTVGGTPITKSDDALDLFTPATQTVLKNYKINGEQVNLLDYGIPYFIQDFVFAYRGKEIDKLTDPDPGDDEGISWSTILEVIATEQRFKPVNNKPKIVAIDDKRTIYSIPQSINTQPNVDINPDPNASVKDIENTYAMFADSLNKLGNNVINLNADSNAVLNLLATNQMAGGFMFNGDAIYASQGGDNKAEITEEDFHVVTPHDTIVALDLMVFNKQVTDQTIIDKSYDVIKQVCLNNGKFGAFDETETTLTYDNFDYVNYTPTLNVIYDHVIGNYFENWQLPFVKIEDVKNTQIELPINNLLKSNFNFAWMGFKNSLK